MAHFQPSSASFSAKAHVSLTQPEIIRRSANYHPSIWGQHFLNLPSENEIIDADAGMEERLLILKNEAREMLVSTNDPSEQLNLIDHIQRLGLAYHFEKEIGVALQHEYDINFKHGKHDEEHDLYTLALRFRLLRQEGHDVSCDVFNMLKDHQGNIKEFTASNVQGMLSLYEATHMRVRGEDLLEDALEFTVTHLEPIKSQLTNPLAAQVAHALVQPLQKTLPRIAARRYISLYEEAGSCSQLLLDFAKLDFNQLQKLHQRELRDISRWWKDLDFAEKLPFARDRMVESYFWSLGVYYEPQYGFARKILAKVVSMTSIVDDIYDVYGTLEELVLFTNAIERWDMRAVDQLPEYMRECYRALLDVYSEAEEELAKQGISYRIDYAKATMKRLGKAYMEEARWFHQGYVPSMDEYMKVALVTGGYITLATIMFAAMSKEYVTNEAFEWLIIKNPAIINASSLISRLTDDIVGHEFEQERGHVVSAVECYMKQHGVSKQEAYVALEKQVAGAWKDMNQECLGNTEEEAPMSLLNRVLNLARFINLVYKDKDGYTHSNTRTRDLIASLLVDPLQI